MHGTTLAGSLTTANSVKTCRGFSSAAQPMSGCEIPPEGLSDSPCRSCDHFSIEPFKMTSRLRSLISAHLRSSSLNGPVTGGCEITQKPNKSSSRWCLLLARNFARNTRNITRRKFLTSKALSMGWNGRSGPRMNWL